MAKRPVKPKSSPGKPAGRKRSAAKPARGKQSRVSNPPGKKRNERGARPSGKGHNGAHKRPAIATGPSSIMRIAKAMARAGLCSRRDGERWIEDGRVKVNGKLIDSPALNVGPKDRIEVDDAPLPQAEPVRLWRYYKPKGLVTSHKDPQGRSTVFASLPPELPRVVSVGRLDYSTEGLLLLTNDGALARHLELPSTGWLRRYRVRAHGRVGQAQLDALKDGITVEGVRYGPIEAVLDQKQGSNVWLSIGIREGKNREVRRVLETLGLQVNRLIRISYGPFQLKEMKDGTVELVPRRVLIDQLGPRLAAQLGISDGPDAAPVKKIKSDKPIAKVKKLPRVDKKDRPKRLELVDKPVPGKKKRKTGAGGRGPGKMASGKNLRRSEMKHSSRSGAKSRAGRNAKKGQRNG